MGCSYLFQSESLTLRWSFPSFFGRSPCHTRICVHKQPGQWQAGLCVSYSAEVSMQENSRSCSVGSSTIFPSTRAEAPHCQQEPCRLLVSVGAERTPHSGETAREGPGAQTPPSPPLSQGFAAGGSCASSPTSIWAPCPPYYKKILGL